MRVPSAICAIILFAVAFIAFLPAMDNGLVWDDTPTIENNQDFRGLGPSHLRWMFTTFHTGHYQPLSWVTLGLDFIVWDMRPLGYHLTNVIIHAGNAVLVYLLALSLYRRVERGAVGAAGGELGTAPNQCTQQRAAISTTDRSWQPRGLKPAAREGGGLKHAAQVEGELEHAAGEECGSVHGRSGSHRAGASMLGGAMLAALLFAVHPLRVESVAWVTERRDVLSALFVLLTVLAYLRADSIATNGRHGLWISAALLMYLLSLLSKAGAMTLPVILLVLDWFPLRRLGGGRGRWLGSDARRVWLEKVPFVALAVVFATVAALAQTEAGATAYLEDHTIVGRCAQACYGLVFYMCKTIVPVALVPLNELHLPVNPLAWKYLVSIAVTVAAGVALMLLTRRKPAIAATGICYAVLLSPVLGFFQSGSQEVADRYSYLACIGWAILVGGWFKKRKLMSLPVYATVVCVVVAAGLGTLTWRQCRVWESKVSLWTHAARHATDSRITFKNLGNALESEGDIDGAIGAYRTARRIEPLFPELGLSRLLIRRGRFQEAVDDLEAILIDHPDEPEAHRMLATALVETGRADRAIVHYRQALRLEPEVLAVRRELAARLRDLGRLDEAVAEHELLAAAWPGDAGVLLEFGLALRDAGRDNEANMRFLQAVRLDPALREILVANGIELNEAAAAVTSSSQQAADSEELDALVRQADQKASLGRTQEAIALYEEIVRRRTDDSLIHYRLGALMSGAGRLDEAVRHLRRAIELAGEFPEAHLSLGMTYGLQEKPEQAAREYREAIRIDPDMLPAHYNLGTVLGHLGEYDEAIEAMRRALELARNYDRTDLIPRIQDRIEKFRVVGGPAESRDGD